MNNTMLKERIHAAFPVTQPAYRKLLGLLDIELSDEVPTAAVSLGPRSVMKINPEFLELHCRTDATLTMLVLHETMHVLLGHTRLYERITPEQNIAFDAVINATLCRMLPSPEYTALFRDLYASDLLPEALLRPPDGVGTPWIRWTLEGEVGRLHQALYEDDTVTTGELLAMLEKTVAGGNRDGNGGEKTPSGHNPPGELLGRLLGNHGPGSEDESPSPELLEGIRDLVSHWPRETVRKGRDMGGTENRRTLHVRNPGRIASTILRRALLHVAVTGPAGIGGPLPTIAPRPSARPFAAPRDRRAAVLGALGQPPLLWETTVEDRTRRPVSRTHVYLDVSGSIESVVPLLYGAILSLAEFVHPMVHLFSTKVFDTKIGELHRGKITSTYGTDITCVTAHMIEHRVRRAVIVTDGWVGSVPKTHRARLPGLRAVIVLTHGGDPGFAAELGAAVAELPHLS